MVDKPKYITYIAIETQANGDDMHSYNTLRKASDKTKEDNDCAVMAVAVVTDKSYKEVHKVMEDLGRKKGHGTSLRIMLEAIRELGFNFDCNDVTKRRRAFNVMHTHYNYKVKNLTCKHIKKFPRAFEEFGDRYIIDVHGGSHVAGVRNGKVIDYSADTAARINAVYMVSKDEES